MSFILDALKKLEQQKKQQESIPDITTIHQVPEKIQKKKPLWPYILIGALVLNVLIFILNMPWLYKADTHQTSPYKEETKTKPQINNTGDLKTKKKDVQIKSQSSDSTKASILPSSEEDQLSKDQIDIKPPMNSSYEFLPSGEELAKLKKEIRQERLNIIRMPVEDKETKDFEHFETTVDVIDFERLPLEIKAQLPVLKITGHIFSDNPDNRIININGSIFKEGDRVSDGLILKEITLNGAVFDYKGTLFLKKVY